MKNKNIVTRLQLSLTLSVNIVNLFVSVDGTTMLKYLDAKIPGSLTRN